MMVKEASESVENLSSPHPARLLPHQPAHIPGGSGMRQLLPISFLMMQEYPLGFCGRVLWDD